METIGLLAAGALVVIWLSVAYIERRRGPISAKEYQALGDKVAIPNLPAETAQADLMTQANSIDAPSGGHSH